MMRDGVFSAFLGKGPMKSNSTLALKWVLLSVVAANLGVLRLTHAQQDGPSFEVGNSPTRACLGSFEPSNVASHAVTLRSLDGQFSNLQRDAERFNRFLVGVHAAGYESQGANGRLMRELQAFLGQFEATKNAMLSASVAVQRQMPQPGARVQNRTPAVREALTQIPVMQRAVTGLLTWMQGRTTSASGAGCQRMTGGRLPSAAVCVCGPLPASNLNTMACTTAHNTPANAACRSILSNDVQLNNGIAPSPYLYRLLGGESGAPMDNSHIGLQHQCLMPMIQSLANSLASTLNTCQVASRTRR